MKYISDYTNELNYFSEKEFEVAKEKLQANIKQKDFFRTQQYSFQKGETIVQDLSNENRRRSYFSDCKFINSNLSNMGMSGSLLKEVTFRDCLIDNTKLDSCDFEDCTFICSDQEKFKSKNLNISKSTLLACNFNNCYLYASNFTDTVFINTIFQDCTWQSLALENSIFKNTILDSVTLKKLNFEYSQFDSIKMNNVRLPFPTIPYIFKGLSYLMETRDNVYISSANSKIGQISKEEYLTYLYDLEVFYNKTQNYFPLANIYISTGQWNKAYSAIMLGISISMKLHSYRMTYYFCRLLQMYNEFSEKQCAAAYELITNSINQNGFHMQDMYTRDRYMEPIRNLLLNEKESYLTIEILTNIEDGDYDKLSKLLETTDDVVRFINKKNNTQVKYYAEVRHYCPFSLFFKMFGDPQTLLTLVGSIHLVFTGLEFIYKKAIKLRDDYYDFKIKKEQLRGYELDNKIKEKTLEIDELEIERKKQSAKESNEERQDSEYMKDKHKFLKDNNILIINGYHNISNTNYNINDEDFHFFNY